MKLLIVDDYPKIRAMLKSMYGFMFDETIEASDGTEEIELYKKHLPNWVLMDVKMKQMDGITATQKIKQFDKNAKIIVVTLFEDSLTKENAINAGAYELVPKSDLTKIGDLFFPAT